MAASLKVTVHFSQGGLCVIMFLGKATITSTKQVLVIKV